VSHGGHGAHRGLSAALGAVCLTVAALALAGPARADVPIELRGRRILGVEIAGETEGITSARALGIPIGATLTRPLVRTALRRLVASGRWIDVQIDAVAEGGGVRVIAHLVPRLEIARVDVTGNAVLDDQEIARGLGLSTGGPIERDGLATLERGIDALYAARGYLATRARIDLLDTDDPFAKVLVIRIVEGRPTRIVAIRFLGQNPSGVSLRSLLDVDVGDVLDRHAIEDAVRAAESHVRERGWYEAKLDPPHIVAANGGVIVEIPTFVGPRYELRVRGFAPLARGDVETALELGTEWLGSTAARLGLREHVVELYRRHGFMDTSAEVSRRLSEDGQGATLVVDVHPGPQVQVTEIAFPGAHHFQTSLLRDQIYSYLEEDLPGSTLFYPVDSAVADRLGVGGAGGARRRAVPPPLVVEPRRTFYAPTYEQALDHIRELYQSEGYLAARVGPAELTRVDPHTAHVVVPVEEGPRAMLHRLVLAGNEVVTDHDIADALELESGAPFSYLALEEARVRVLDLYRERGYLYARVEPEVHFSSDRTRAEVTLRIVERFPVTVGSIEIQGATRTTLGLIRDRLALREGDLYRPSAARESQDRLLELSIFAGVTVTPEDADLPARVKNIVVTVTERPAQYLDVSAGISTGEGVRTGFEYGYRNLFGYAVGASIRAQFAYQFLFVEQLLQDRFDRLPLGDRLERTVTLGFTVPNIWRLRGLRASLDLAHVRDNERDFGYDKNGVSLTLGWRPTKRLSFAASENLENNNIDLFVGEALDEYLRTVTDPRLQRLLRVPEGETTLLETRTTASLDLRDSAFTPTRGVFFSVAADWARTLRTEAFNTGDTSAQFISDFLKLAVTASGYVPLSERVVFAAQLRVGRIVHLDGNSKTYPNRAFFLGGIDTMRGYLQDALVPQDIADRIAADPGLDPNSVVRGGDAYVLVRGELRFPILGPLLGGIFADIGNLWADAAELDVLELRPTAGMGLRIATPVGPIALDYGVILVRREALHEPFGAFHFSIGLF